MRRFREVDVVVHLKTSVFLLAWLVVTQSPWADDMSSGGVLFAGDKALGSFREQVRPLLNEYCVDCHSGGDPSGDRDFAKLKGRIEDDDTLVDLQDILDQLNLGEMPPADAEQPNESERLQAIEVLTSLIGEYHRSRNVVSETPLRRLNAREYRNTVRDLFGLNMAMFDPTVEFPRDQTIEHLDNIGSELVTSGYLLGKYLDAAEQVVTKSLYPLEKPSVQTWRFESGLRQQPEIDQVHRKTNQYGHLTLYDVIGADKHEGAYAPIHAFSQGVPHDGFYKIRFVARALHRDHPYDDEFLGRDRQEPLRLGIRPGLASAGSLHLPQPIEPLLTELDLQDGEAKYEVRIWLDQGFTPRFTFRNGLMDARNLWSRIQKKYPDQFPKPKRPGIVEARYNAIANGKLPQIQIDDIEIEGPFYDEWPKPSQVALLGTHVAKVCREADIQPAALSPLLKRFMQKAYRRTVDDEEVAAMVSFVAQRVEARGGDRIAAFADGIKSILCSPHFLYLNEGNGPLPAEAIANRLTYFLWSSKPDAELLENAERLATDSDYLEQQAERLLNDDRVSAFVDGFTDSWLTLRDLGATPPDRASFSRYYQHRLGEAMRSETLHFVQHLIDNNLDVVNLIDSDFTFVNKRLCWHYQIPVPDELKLDAEKFAKVELSDRRRGGLLGQASVLTVTANGIDTSPVVRGVWLLENLLGTPPSPPPPDVEPLDPDVRGAKSIRDQLEKHRSVPSCNECHRKIDPLGFALENFDPVGRWRNQYSQRVPIDSAGKLPNGKEFADITELKTILLDNQEQVARALLEKMFAYALGRTLTPHDRPYIDQASRQLAERGNGLRDMIKLVVTSELFQAG